MNEEWVDAFVEQLAEDEGTEGRKVALEGGTSTRGYGITSIAESLKSFLSLNNLNADEMSDKDLAKQIVIHNIEKMKQSLGEDTWNTLPTSMKIIASDQYYNSGKLFPGFSNDLKTGNYESALKNTLDIISANDQQTNSNGVMNGLINRRVRNFNLAATELGINTIKDYNVGNSNIEGKQTAVTYNFDNGEPFVVNTSAGIHSNSLKKNNYLPDPIQNIVDTVGNTIKDSAVGQFVGNTINKIGEIGIQDSENAKQVQQLIQGYGQIDQETKQQQKDFEIQSSKEFIDNIEPPQLWNVDFAQPYDKEDLDAINDIQFKRQQDLKNKYTLGQATAGAYESETIEANIYKQFNAEKLAPDSTFVLTKELLDDLSKDLPEDFIDEFAHAHSLAHAQQIRQQLLSHLELEDKIYSQGRVKGTMLRLLAAFTDPGAWAAIVATDGLLAPVVAINKSVRAYRVLRKGAAGAVSIGAIETYLASQRPDLDIDDVMHGVMTGAFLGGLFGIRTPKVKSNSFTKQFKDGMDEGETKLIRDDGGFEPPPSSCTNLVPGPNNPNPLKPNGERTFDWYDPNYDLALHTTKRPDGRFEIKMIENQTGKPDELIMEVRKDGTVEIRKCK